MITGQSKRHRNLHKNSAAIVHIAANAAAEAAVWVKGEQSVGGA